VRNLSSLGTLTEDGFLASLGMTAERILQQPARVSQAEHEPESAPLALRASGEGLQAHDVLDGLLIEARKGVRWNDFVVEVLVQSIQRDEILIKRSVSQLGSQLAEEVEKLTVARNCDIVPSSERLQLLRNRTPKKFGCLSILARHDGMFGIRAILITGIIKTLNIPKLTQWPGPSLLRRQPRLSSTWRQRCLR